MQVSELQAVLNNMIGILQDNKAVVTPTMLNVLERLIVILKDLKVPGVEALTNIVDIEKRLTETTATDSIVNILTDIQKYPFVLWLLSFFV